MPDYPPINRIDDLDPEFRRRLTRTLNQANRETAGKFPAFARWHIFETVRSAGRQRDLYAQGRTRPGPIVTWSTRSRHTAGQAADIVWLDAAGNLRWDGPKELWQILGHCARANGLAWGGDWRRPDRPHIELPGEH